MAEKNNKPSIGVQIIKSNKITNNAAYNIIKSSTPEQLTKNSVYDAADFVEPHYWLEGLASIVDNSTILPQCISAYSRNIAGFGISLDYIEDEEETAEMAAEWNKAQEVLDLISIDKPLKAVFEDIITDRETYGIAYLEVIRNSVGEVVQIEHIVEPTTIRVTKPMPPYVDYIYHYKGRKESRRKKFKSYRQQIGGKVVYFKEFGDPRRMDKHTGKYAKEGDVQPITDDNSANEILEFKIGSKSYGKVRWIGQVLTIDGARRAEVLNNNYFRKGRHTPLMIIVKGGTLSDDSFNKLQDYMNDIEGERGQHAFMILEAENKDTKLDFSDVSQPTVEIKELANILQKDELFQEYQSNARRKAQSSFLLPDLYVGYTTDFNRATAQTAMEVTEKQVFQPERESLAWTINNKLLNGYGFKYVGVKFDTPDLTNPDDIQKILNVAERAGGLTMNDARDLAYNTLGKNAEPYDDEIGNIPLALLKVQQTALTSEVEQSIQKAKANSDDDIVPVLKAILRAIEECDTIDEE